MDLSILLMKESNIIKITKFVCVKVNNYKFRNKSANVQGTFKRYYYV